MTATDEDLAPGTVFGRYVIGRKVGQGGMGAVYEASHSSLGKRVALKVLLPEAARSDEARARFVREGEAAARLRHPHVVDITDVGVQDDVPYLVMEYLEGEDLASVIRRERALPVDALTDLMLPVLDAVSAAHAAGIVHRDLKPENIFLARTRLSPREPKILDFGISKVVDLGTKRALTATNTLVGTAHYMSPEQAQNSKHVDARTDQYSLGVILYECATGRHPFATVGAEDSLYKLLQAIVQGEFPAPRAVLSTLPESFERVVLQAMASQPDLRFATVQTFAQALLPFATPTVRATWERVLVDPPADSRVVEPTSVETSASVQPSGFPSWRETAAGVGLPPATPTVTPSLTGASVTDPISETPALAVDVPRSDTLGTSVRMIAVRLPTYPAKHPPWKMLSSVVAVVALVVTVAVTRHPARPPVHVVSSLPRMDLPPPTVVPLAETSHAAEPVVPSPATVSDAGAVAVIASPTHDVVVAPRREVVTNRPVQVHHLPVPIAAPRVPSPAIARPPRPTTTNSVPNI